MATGRQIRALRGAAYDLVSASVRLTEAEYVNPESKTSARKQGESASGQV